MATEEDSTTAETAKTPNEVKMEFSRILSKIKKHRLSFCKVKDLKSVKKLKHDDSDMWKMYFYFYFALIAIAWSMFFFNGLHTVDGMTKFIMGEDDLESESVTIEKCLVDMPETLTDMFRPMTDCSMCRGLDSVPKVTRMSPKDFEYKHAYSGRPVVIVDGTKNWTATEVFNFNFFKQLYPEDSPVMGDQCQFFPYKTSFESLNEVFNMTEDRANLRDGSNPWYIGWSNCDQEATDVLRQHYKRPYFLPPQSESSKTDWIFMGAPGYGAHMHIDHVGNPSWQAQIKGQKLWTLEPPPECFLECQKLDVTVNPGEIIVLDTNRWFHKTLVLGNSISITIGSEYD